MCWQRRWLMGASVSLYVRRMHGFTYYCYPKINSTVELTNSAGTNERLHYGALCGISQNDISSLMLARFLSLLCRAISFVSIKICSYYKSKSLLFIIIIAIVNCKDAQRNFLTISPSPSALRLCASFTVSLFVMWKTPTTKIRFIACRQKDRRDLIKS